MRLTITLFTVLALSRLALGDGCFLWDGKRDLSEPSQKAVLGLKEGVQTMVLQVKYQGEAEKFAWVVPLPGKPEVDAIAAEKSPFAELSRYTQTRSHYGKESRLPDVEVVERKVAGVYDVAVLKGEDPKALRNWLEKAGFAFPAEHEAVLKFYTDRKWHFVAMRIDPTQLDPDKASKVRTGELQPIRFRFKTDQMVFPLRISSVNSGQTEVLLYTVCDKPMVPAKDFGKHELQARSDIPFYSDAGSRIDPDYGTFVRSEAKDLPLTWEAIAAGKEEKLYVCKYRGVFARNELKDDLALQPFNPVAFWEGYLALAGGSPDQQLVALRILSRHGKEYAARFEYVRKNLDALRNKYHLEIAEQQRAEGLRLAASSDASVRMQVFSTSGIPADVYEKLVADPDEKIRERVALHTLSDKSLIALAGDRSAAVKLALLKQTTLPVEALEVLARDGDDAIRIALTRRLKLPEKVLEKLLSDKQKEVRVAAAHAEGTPREVQVEILTTDGDAKTRAGFAKGLSKPESILVKLADDPDASVRQALARNLNLPSELAAKLSKDEDAGVRLAAVKNPHITDKALAARKSDKSVEVRRAAALSCRDPNGLAAMAADTDTTVRSYIAQNPKTPRAALEVLSKDAEKTVSFYAKQRLDTGK